MNRDDAYEAVGILISLTTGTWDDANIMAYVDEFETLTEPEVLRECCLRVARSWTEPRRVPLGVVLSCYQTEVKRLVDAAQQALDAAPLDRTVVPLARGITVARQAYIDERRRMGDDAPNMSIFDDWMAAITMTTPERREWRARQHEGRRRG